MSRIFRRIGTLLQNRHPIEVPIPSNLTNHLAVAERADAVEVAEPKEVPDDARAPEVSPPPPPPLPPLPAVEFPTPADQPEAEDDAVEPTDLHPDPHSDDEPEPTVDEAPSDVVGPEPATNDVLSVDDPVQQLHALLSDLPDRLSELGDLSGQIDALRTDMHRELASLGSKVKDHRDTLDDALTDVRAHAGAHGDSLIQIREELELVARKEAEAVAQFDRLTTVVKRQNEAIQRMAAAMASLQDRLSHEHDALMGFIASTRKMLLTAVILAAVAVAVVVPVAMLLLS
ncbi:MAG: hypothetical protein KAS72_06470 [Phycisphaerales bacterium]|nr:hypothetical protein [Phycisphaerales bacterium]